MSTKKEAANATKGNTVAKRDQAPDDFPAELSGEFAELSDVTVKNVGAIAGLSVRGGGYFGISVTDDGGSIRLAVRNGSFALDKRFYAVAKFEGALAYCLNKLRVDAE